MKAKRTKLTLQSIPKKKVKVDQDYLIKANNRFAVGQFTKEWHGLVFDDGKSFYQLDGEDGTKWQAIWELPKSKL